MPSTTIEQAADARSQIEAVNAAFAAAAARGDADAMAACSTSDALLLPPGYPLIPGRDAIAAFWSAGIAAGLRSVELDTVTLDITDRHAVEVGRATVVLEPQEDDDGSVDVGKYVVVHRRGDDGWAWALDVVVHSSIIHAHGSDANGVQPAQLTSGAGRKLPQQSPAIVAGTSSVLDRRSAMQVRRVGAEVLGTFVLVFGGVGSAVIAGEAIGALGVALAFGLSLLAMAYAIGPISGCHINPAVTLGLLASRRIELREAVGYWIGQIIGALLAAAALAVVVKARAGGYDFSEEGFGANGYGDHSPGNYPAGAAFLVEVILTAILVFTVLAATDKLSSVAFAGIPIGLVLTLVHLVGIPVDNTSVNPARSLGPAVFVGDWALEHLWVFILAPLVGGLLGSLLHRLLFADARRVGPEESAVASGDASGR